MVFTWFLVFLAIVFVFVFLLVIQVISKSIFFKPFVVAVYYACLRDSDLRIA